MTFSQPATPNTTHSGAYAHSPIAPAPSSGSGGVGARGAAGSRPGTSSAGAGAAGRHSVSGPGGASGSGSTSASSSVVPAKRTIGSVSGGSNVPGPVRKGSVDSVDASKKKRVSLSCAQCAKRKQKCNREFPCNHCIVPQTESRTLLPAQSPIAALLTSYSLSARKVPELCVPYNPAANNSTSSALDAATTHRLERMETVLSFVVRHHGGLWGYKEIKDWMHSPPFSRIFPSTPSGTPRGYIEGPTSEKKPDLSRRRSGRPLGISTGAGEDDDESSDEELEDKPDFDLEPGEGPLGDEERLEELGELEGMPESMEARGKVNIKHDIHGTPAENLQQLIRDCGVSPHKLAELVHELPPKHFADKIIDWFFARLNFARYPIDERHFRTSYEGLYNRSMMIDPSDVRALPMVFIVLALAVRLAPEEWAGDDQTRRLSSLRMYWSSRRSILIATAIQSESLELVISRLLSAMYLVTIHDRRLTECWSQLGASLRTAQAIGLHRDGSKLGLDPHQTEYRRRIWSYLYHADKVYSLVLGRPPSISDSYTDTLPPSNVDLSALYPSSPLINTTGPSTAGPSAPPPTPNAPPAPPAPFPLSQPTTATFLILRRQLSTIVGRVVHHFQKLDEAAGYKDVEALQVDLEKFTDWLPPHFRMYEPDKSLDETLFWLPVHRFSLISEIIMTTIILHRPWLLRKLSTNRYAASRTACFEMAKLDFQLRQEHHRAVPDYKVFQSQGQFKMFNSAMIAGISAIIDPRGPDGDTMRRILGAFLGMNPWSEVRAKDETTRKEVQIIQTLSRRAGQIYENSFAPGELGPQDRDSVSLLLGLRGDVAPPEERSGAGAGNGPLSQPGAGLPGSGSIHPGATHGAKGWASLINNQRVGLHNHSPGSSVHEDDSQRMLDHWLNANTSLAVGTINGPLPPIDPTGLGYMPMPAISLSNLGPVPGQYVPPTPMGGPGVQTPGHAHGHGQSQTTPMGLGPMPWDTPVSGPSHAIGPQGQVQGQGQPSGGTGMTPMMGVMDGEMTYAGGFNEGVQIHGGGAGAHGHGHGPGHGHGHAQGPFHAPYPPGQGAHGQGMLMGGPSGSGMGGGLGGAGGGGMSMGMGMGPGPGSGYGPGPALIAGPGGQVGMQLNNQTPSGMGLGLGGGVGGGMGGMGLGLGGHVGFEGEKSDEYWNALIDGILGTTGGSGAGGVGQ